MNATPVKATPCVWSQYCTFSTVTLYDMAIKQYLNTDRNPFQLLKIMYFVQVSHNTHVTICYTPRKLNFKIYNHQKYIVVSVPKFLKKFQN